MCQTGSADDEAGLEHHTGFLASGEKPSQPEAFAFSYGIRLFLVISQIKYMLSDSVQKLQVYSFPFKFPGYLSPSFFHYLYCFLVIYTRNLYKS